MFVKVRRGLSISLITLLWLAPLAALLPGADEARLPACCRRHGAHHCTMAAQSSAASAIPDSQHALSVPQQCPHFPGFAPASTAVFALVRSPFPALHTEAQRPFAELAIVHLSQPRAHTSRGPPASS